jgi:hypothetical protein
LTLKKVRHKYLVLLLLVRLRQDIRPLKCLLKKSEDIVNYEKSFFCGFGACDIWQILERKDMVLRKKTRTCLQTANSLEFTLFLIVFGDCWGMLQQAALCPLIDSILLAQLYCTYRGFGIEKRIRA